MFHIEMSFENYLRFMIIGLSTELYIKTRTLLYIQYPAALYRAADANGAYKNVLKLVPLIWH